MNIAIIPARGGSKRIPRKNLRSFHGLPIIAYAIKTAIESDIFAEVIVSTDDEEIAEVAESFGAKIPWLRPKDLADDYTTTLRVMQDAVQKLRISQGSSESVCCIYPATPFLKSEYIAAGYKTLVEGDWNYVLSGIKVNINPQRFFTLEKSKQVELLLPEYELARTQDLFPVFSDAGQFYWGKATAWESGLPIFSSKSTIIELPNESVIDIDIEDDWQKAELMYERKKGK